MKSARITFLVLFTLGVLGGVNNAWKDSAAVTYKGVSQLQETADSFFSLVGILNYFIAPTLFAIYVSLVVAGYQKFIKPKVQRKFRAASIVLTFFAGIVGQVILIALFVSLIR